MGAVLKRRIGGVFVIVLAATGTVVTPPTPPAGVPGTYVPTDANTGIPAGTVLKPYQGTLTVTTPGAIIEDLDIFGDLRIRANNVTVRRCKVRGTDHSAGPLSQIVFCDPNVQSGFRMEDSEVVADVPSVYTDGIKGGNMTLLRVKCHNVTDTLLITGGTQQDILACMLYGNTHWLVDPSKNGGPSHDDGIQIQSGSNTNIIGNYVPGAVNTAIQVTNDVAAAANGGAGDPTKKVKNLVIRKNVLGGGAATLNVAEKGMGAFEGFQLVDNTFLGNGTLKDGSGNPTDALIPATTRAVSIITGNVRPDGSAANIRNG